MGIKNPGRAAFTVFDTAVVLLLARAYTVPEEPLGIENVLEDCQLSGVVSPTSQAYCSVPPLPDAERFTVAVTFAEEGLLKVTLEAVGAVTAAAPSSQVTATSAPTVVPKGFVCEDQVQLVLPLPAVDVVKPASALFRVRDPIVILSQPLLLFTPST